MDHNTEMELGMGDDDNMMMMPSSFSIGMFKGPFLFSDWKITTGKGYAGAIIFTIVLGVFYEFLRGFRLRIEGNVARRVVMAYQSLNSGRCDNCNVEQPRTHIWGFRTMNAILMMTQLTIAYILMLIAMTYNTGLFFAVIFGCGLGYFLFTPHIEYSNPSKKDDDDPHENDNLISTNKNRNMSEVIGGSCH